TGRSNASCKEWSNTSVCLITSSGETVTCNGSPLGIATSDSRRPSVIIPAPSLLQSTKFPARSKIIPCFHTGGVFLNGRFDAAFADEHRQRTSFFVKISLQFPC